MSKGYAIYDGTEAGLNTVISLIKGAFAFSTSKRMRVDFREDDNGMTRTQENSLHLWLENFATVLNDAGIDQRLLLDSLKEGAEIPNTKHSLKELYKVLLAALEGKESTTKMNRKEPGAIAEIFAKVITERVAHAAAVVPPPWPDRFNGGGRE